MPLFIGCQKAPANVSAATEVRLAALSADLILLTPVSVNSPLVCQSFFEVKLKLAVNSFFNCANSSESVGRKFFHLS